MSAWSTTARRILAESSPAAVTERLGIPPELVMVIIPW